VRLPWPVVTVLDTMFYVTVDIMKRTERSQPDHDNLCRAISALEEVMTYAVVTYCIFLI